MPARKAAKARKGTRSSAFGAAGRISHDASAFYKSALYADQPSQQAADLTGNPLPQSAPDKIFPHSSEDMHELPDGCVHLMVTSPPYNVGKEYDRNLGLDEYLAMLRRVWVETLRVLAPGGRACINVANLGASPIYPC